jgi:hypothetical protein
MTSNSIFSILTPYKQQRSRYPNPLYDQFAAELNVELKPQENDIKISPNLIYGAIDPLVDRI